MNVNWDDVGDSDPVADLKVFSAKVFAQTFTIGGPYMLMSTEKAGEYRAFLERREQLKAELAAIKRWRRLSIYRIRRELGLNRLWAVSEAAFMSPPAMKVRRWRFDRRMRRYDEGLG